MKKLFYLYFFLFYFYCSIVLFVVSTENPKTVKYNTFSKKHQLILLFAVSVEMKTKKYLKKKNQQKYQKFLVSLKMYNYFKNMFNENIRQESRLKNNDKTRNFFVEEI